ncbi:MAG TPA: hypothetical protein VGX76_19765 [Pirellulales bacterium]|nr:hypothetical protein [Pirellulales bacterium]
MDDFNAYRAWLGVTSDANPPNHYELLGLPLLRAEPAKVADAFRRQVARVTPHLSGEHGAIADRILAELAAAKVELLTPTTKRMYDAKLASPKTSQQHAAPRPISAGAMPAAASARTPTGQAPLLQPQTRLGQAPTSTAPQPAAAAYPSSKPNESADIDDWLPPAADPELASSYVPGATSAWEAPATHQGEVGPLPATQQPLSQVPMMATALPVAAVGGYGHQQPVAQAIPIAAVPSQYGAQSPMAVGVSAAPFGVPMAATPVTAATPIGYARVADPYSPGLPAAAQEPNPFMSVAASDPTSTPAARSPAPRTSSHAGMVAVVFAVVALAAAGSFFAFHSSTEPVAANTAGKVAAAADPSNGNGGKQRHQGAKSKSTAGAGQRATPPDEATMVEDRAVESALDKAVPEESANEPESTEPEPADGGAMLGPEAPDMQTTPKSGEPAVPAPPPPAEATPRQLAAVKEALAAARTALGKRDLEAAQEQLDLATLDAVTPELEKELSRVQLLAEYVEHFWKAVSETLTMLQATEELTLDGAICTVVDASADSLTIHVPGKNREFKLREIPTSLAVTLAERWLDKADDRTPLVIGAFLLADPKGDDDQARRLFEQAAKSVDAAPLIAELDAAKGG